MFLIHSDISFSNFFFRYQPIERVFKFIVTYHFLIILDTSQLKESLDSLLHEHLKLCTEAACSSLSITRLQQRLAVLERYFVALGRQTPIEGRTPSKKSQANQTNLSKQKRLVLWCLMPLSTIFQLYRGSHCLKTILNFCVCPIKIVCDLYSCTLYV
jgi:hypothetical protein